MLPFSVHVNEVKWKLVITCWVSGDVMLLILWNEKVEWYWIELLNWIIGLNWIELCKELNWIKLIGLNYLFNELLIIELKNWTYGIELFIIDLN